MKLLTRKEVENAVRATFRLFSKVEIFPSLFPSWLKRSKKGIGSLQWKPKNNNVFDIKKHVNLSYTHCRRSKIRWNFFHEKESPEVFFCMRGPSRVPLFLEGVRAVSCLHTVYGLDDGRKPALQFTARKENNSRPREIKVENYHLMFFSSTAEAGATIGAATIKVVGIVGLLFLWDNTVSSQLVFLVSSVLTGGGDCRDVDKSSSFVMSSFNAVALNRIERISQSVSRINRGRGRVNQFFHSRFLLSYRWIFPRGSINWLIDWLTKFFAFFFNQSFGRLIDWSLPANGSFCVPSKNIPLNPFLFLAEILHVTFINYRLFCLWLRGVAIHRNTSTYIWPKMITIKYIPSYYGGPLRVYTLTEWKNLSRICVCFLMYVSTAIVFPLGPIESCKTWQKYSICRADAKYCHGKCQKASFYSIIWIYYPQLPYNGEALRKIRLYNKADVITHPISVSYIHATLENLNPMSKNTKRHIETTAVVVFQRSYVLGGFGFLNLYSGQVFEKQSGKKQKLILFLKVQYYKQIIAWSFQQRPIVCFIQIIAWSFQQRPIVCFIQILAWSFQQHPIVCYKQILAWSFQQHPIVCFILKCEEKRGTHKYHNQHHNNNLRYWK